MGELLVG